MLSTIKKFKIISLFIFVFDALNGQDIILKNDKSELKAKVIEINETSIKYKKWENLEGPIYNFSTRDVFMIIYQNGQREIIKESSSGNKAVNIPSTDSYPLITRKNSTNPKSVNKKSIDSTVTLNSFVNYQPTRLIIGLQSPISFGTGSEFRVIKNLLNIGANYSYAFPKEPTILQTNYGEVYTSAYAPINRLLGNLKHQNSGLFPFFKIGLGINSVKYLDYFGNINSESKAGLTWGFGADIFIYQGMGLSFSTNKLKTINCGLFISIF